MKFRPQQVRRVIRYQASSTKCNASHKPSGTPSRPNLPAFPMLAAHASSINHRALARSSSYNDTHPKAQDLKGHVRMESHQDRDVSIVPKSNGFAPKIGPEQPDLDVTDILIKVAREQDLIILAKDTGALLAEELGASKANADRERSRKCPVPTCPYHNDIRPWLKIEKDEHIMTHFEGDIKFSTKDCQYVLRWPSFVEAPHVYFHRIKLLKDAIRDAHWWSLEGSRDFKCLLCSSEHILSGYLNHLDGCIVRTIRLQASELAQKLRSSPGNRNLNASSSEEMDYQKPKDHWPFLGCGWCYTVRCQCPQMQHVMQRSVGNRC